MKNSIQTQMNNRFQEGIIIFLTYKTQGEYYISYFVTRFSQFLVQSIIFCCHTLPVESLPSLHYKPVWIILALTEHVYYRPTALLPCQLCTPPMTAHHISSQTSLLGICNLARLELLNGRLKSYLNTDW